MNIKNLILLPVVAILASCTSNSGNKPGIVTENFDFAGRQLNYAFAQIAERKALFTEAEQKRNLVSPRTIDADGSLRLVASGDWTSGFFPGELWYMYEYTKDDYWKQKAQEYTAPIEREKLNGRTHDMGFKVYCCFGNGYRLTGDPHYKEVLIQSATTLTTRFKEKIGAIRSWDHSRDKWDCPVIIDNMMNLELLFWASKETGNPMYYDIAVKHALTTMKNHFRDDYSSYHVVDYDTLTGAVLHKHTHQGYAHESAWSRGQAWGLYGYTMCYRETGNPEFLKQAVNIANYIFTSKTLPADLIPYWDFQAPGIPNEPRDVSAATVTASALYELSTYNTEKSGQYKKWADTILDNLTASYHARPEQDRGFLLLHSTGSASHNSEVDVPLVYADYYFLEALLRKKALENNK